MISYLQAIILGLLQGITELFPISSLGHSVILSKALGWTLPQNNPIFLVFLVATHSATALVLFFFFFEDWKKIFLGLIRSLKEREIKDTDYDAKLGWLLIFATVPAGILGLLFEKIFQSLFDNPQLVAFVLILNGLLLLFAEKLHQKNISLSQTLKGSNQRISKLTFAESLKVGLLQSIALIPGFSRTGATLTGSLIVGLSHEDAARFSFLLATPIIAAASLLKLPDLTLPSQTQFLGPVIVGSIFSGMAAFFSVKFLT